MARRLRLSDGATAWLALAALLGTGALACWFAPAALLDWQPARAGEAWRWWSAAWIHWSERHLLANVAGCALVAAFGAAAGVGRPAALAWFLAWPLTQLGLLLQPALAHYGGLSGVLHAGIAAAAVDLLLRARGRRRAGAVAVLGGLLLKIVAEEPWAGPLRHPAGWDIAVAPLAHATGATSGALLAALLCRRRAAGWS